METNNIAFHRLSAAIAWIRFPLILCVVMLHCYCTVPLPPGDHSLYFRLVYPFGLWLGESGVPAFFFISGFLFYISHKSYKDRIKSRIHTLLYPYLLWNSLFLMIYLNNTVTDRDMRWYIYLSIAKKKTLDILNKILYNSI